MTTKLEIIAELKAEYPTLRSGDDEQGYTDLNKTDYEAQIALWADNRLAEETALAELAAAEIAKAAILAKIGITADELKIALS